MTILEVNNRFIMIDKVDISDNLTIEIPTIINNKLIVDDFGSK